MSTAGLWGTLKSLYPHHEKTVPPPFSTTAATFIILAYTLIYVAPFYLSSATRPSSTLNRDAPSVIRARIRSVTLTCIICSIVTLVALISFKKGAEGIEIALHNMGYWPIGFYETAKSTLLIVLLFAGPLFEAGIVEGGWKDWIRLQGFAELFGSWMGYRNLVAGPISEEILFRSSSIPLFLLSRASTNTIVFFTPLIFGVAHVHHFYEYRITHPHTPLVSAVARSLFQLSYTWAFGSFATFLYLRSGSLLAVIIAHSFCNWMGVPRIWGRVSRSDDMISKSDNMERGKDDSLPIAAVVPRPSSSLLWTLTYYVLLFAGAWAFYKYLWVLTESTSALVNFSAKKV